jgi:signal transduction histidine kinase
MAPIILVNKGFESAMIVMINRINESGTPKVNLDISGLNSSINSYTEHALYYSILELVNNSLRHAQCSEISIQIIQNHEDVTVMIEDNGQGFDKKLLSTQKGLGFKSIRSRVEGLNGRFFIDTRPGRGTIITIVIPIIKTRNYGKDQDNSH